MKNILHITSLSSAVAEGRKALLERMKVIDALIGHANLPKGIIVERVVERGKDATYSIAINWRHALHMRAETYDVTTIPWDQVPSRLIRPAAEELPKLIQDLVEKLDAENRACCDALRAIIGPVVAPAAA